MEPRCTKWLWLGAIGLLGSVGATDQRAAAEALLSPPIAASAETYPACHGSPRLNAIYRDAKRSDRSFAVFEMASSQRPQAFRVGARVAGFELADIEEGGVLLAQQSQRCSLRLRGAPADRELRTISAAAVRGQLRSRKAAQSTSVGRLAAF